MTSQNISQYQENQKSQSVAKKVLLLLVAVFIVAPMIFFGACFPLRVISDFSYTIGSFNLGAFLFFIVLLTVASLYLYFLINVILRIARREDLSFVGSLIGKVSLIVILAGIFMFLVFFITDFLSFGAMESDFIILYFFLSIIFIASFLIIKILNSKPDKNK